VIKKILVTGSSGTVGTALTLELLKQNFNVIPLDIKHSLWNNKIDKKTVFRDLRKPLNGARFTKPDLIVHLAANARVHDSVVNPKLAYDNYIMAYNILEYARKNKVPRVLFSSSREIYGESAVGKKRRETVTDVTRMKSPYTASKFGTEALLAAYRDCYGIKTVITRLSNVYGRYDVSERIIPLFIYYALRNRDMVIFGKEKKLDFTFTNDCVDGFVRIIKRFDRVDGLTFNISTGQGIKLISLAKIIIKELDADSKIVLSNKRIGEISSYVGDISLARKMLGYKPKVSLEDGIRHNIKWYQELIKNRKVYMAHRRNLIRCGWA